MSVDISKIDRETKQAILDEAQMEFLSIPTERELEIQFRQYMKMRIDDILLEQIAGEAADRIILEMVQRYKQYIMSWRKTIAQRIINVRRDFFKTFHD